MWDDLRLSTRESDVRDDVALTHGVMDVTRSLFSTFSETSWLEQ